jgi:hypothetical protein
MRSGFAGELDFAEADTPGSNPSAALPVTIAESFKKSLLVDIVVVSSLYGVNVLAVLKPSIPIVRTNMTRGLRFGRTKV